MIPLTLSNIGEENIIKKVGGNPDLKQHLGNLGFVVGGNVTVINMLGGNVIVNVFSGESREFYNLDRLMPAESIRDITDIINEVDKKYEISNTED